jgi:gluconolactonase
MLAGALGAALLAACASAASAQAYRASYPEGPLWHEDALYYAEMGADRVTVVRAGRRADFFRRAGCGPTAIAPYGEGFLVLCHIEGAVVAIDASASVLFVRDRDDAGNVFRDPNDASADGRGGVYFSDPGLFSRQTRPHGALVHIDAAGHIRRLAADLWYPNGVFVDQARRELYLAETFRRRVLRYRLNDDGSLGPESTFFDIAAAPAETRFHAPYAEAGPDGLELGPDGALYVAIYGEGRLLRIDREGRYLGALIARPRYVTNIAFDPDGGAFVTGAFANEVPPFPGEVRRMRP